MYCAQIIITLLLTADALFVSIANEEEDSLNQHHALENATTFTQIDQIVLNRIFKIVSHPDDDISSGFNSDTSTIKKLDGQNKGVWDPNVGSMSLEDDASWNMVGGRDSPINLVWMSDIPQATIEAMLKAGMIDEYWRVDEQFMSPLSKTLFNFFMDFEPRNDAAGHLKFNVVAIICSYYSIRTCPFLPGKVFQDQWRLAFNTTATSNHKSSDSAITYTLNGHSSDSASTLVADQNLLNSLRQSRRDSAPTMMKEKPNFFIH